MGHCSPLQALSLLPGATGTKAWLSHGSREPVSSTRTQCDSCSSPEPVLTQRGSGGGRPPAGWGEGGPRAGCSRRCPTWGANGTSPQGQEEGSTKSGAPWVYVCSLEVRQGRPAAPRSSRHVLAVRSQCPGTWQTAPPLLLALLPCSGTFGDRCLVACMNS